MSLPARDDRGVPRGGDDLCDATAVTLAAWIARGELSAREVVAAHLARIEAEPRLAPGLVGPVALEAILREDRPDVAVVTHRLGPAHGER